MREMDLVRGRVGGGVGARRAGSVSRRQGERERRGEVASAGRALRKCRTERRQERGGVVLGLYDERAQAGRVIYA